MTPLRSQKTGKFPDNFQNVWSLHDWYNHKKKSNVPFERMKFPVLKMSLPKTFKYYVSMETGQTEVIATEYFSRSLFSCFNLLACTLIYVFVRKKFFANHNNVNKIFTVWKKLKLVTYGTALGDI